MGNHQTSGNQYIPTSTSQTHKTHSPVASTSLVLSLLRKTGYIHTLLFMYTICNSAHLDKSPIWEHKILGDTLDRHSFFSLCPDCKRRSCLCIAIGVFEGFV